MAKRRGHRGNGRQMFGANDGDEIEDIRPEDSIVVVDESGNPVHEDVEVVHAAIEADEQHETNPEPDDAFANLQRSHEALKTSHAQQTQQLQQVQQRAQNLEADNHSTTKALFATAITSAKDGLASAKARYAEASRTGDWEGAADAQEEIAVAAGELRQLEAASAQFDREPAERPRREQTLPPAPPADFNARTDAWINSSLMPNEQRFARQYREQIFTEGSDKVFRKLQALANVAAIEHERDSPEYIAYIEREMKFKPEEQPPVVEKKASQNRRPPIPAAPAGRGGPTKTTQVVLSADERAMAKRLGMSEKAYALHKRTAEEGATDPNYKGPRFTRHDPAIRGNQ